MDYITERITNIAELEAILDECLIIGQLLKKESPQNENLQRLFELLNDARNFEFCIERRKTIHSE